MLRTLSLAAAGFAGLGLMSAADDDTCCTQTCSAAPAANLVSEEARSIVDVAKSTGVHNTLVQAVVAAGLADALSGDGPLTVFAPTDEAFAKLPKGTLESLLQPENRDTLAASSVVLARCVYIIVNVLICVLSGIRFCKPASSARKISGDRRRGIAQRMTETGETH